MDDTCTYPFRDPSLIARREEGGAIKWDWEGASQIFTLTKGGEEGGGGGITCCSHAEGGGCFTIVLE